MNTHTQDSQEVTHQETASNQSTNFQKILVAIDYLPSTVQVFERAMGLAEKYGSNLKILHCLKDFTPAMSDAIAIGNISAYGGVYSQEMLDLEEQLRQEAIEDLQAWLHSFCQQATSRGIPAEYDYSIGEAGKQICNYAQTWGADLIVVGRRGRNGLSEMFLGSVSNYILHHAPCSVFIVQ